MAGDNINPELARIIARLQDRIRVLESRNPPVGARNLNDLDDVYINVLSRINGDKLTWLESGQYWTNSGGAAFDYLQATATASTGLTNAVIKHLVWTVDSAHTSGADISMATNAQGVNAPLINTNGIYAVNCLVGASATNAGDTFNNYIALLDVEPNSGGRDAALMTDSYYPGLDGGGTRHYGNSALNWVGYLPAGANFDVTLDMRGGGAGTWDVLYGTIQIDRIG